MMYSQFFPKNEQPQNVQEEQGFKSRILAYEPELLMMEWQFFHAGHVIPLHDHYHAQISYIVSGAAKVTLADGTEQLCKPGDAAAFAPHEAHSVVTAEDNTVIIDVFNPIRLDHLANHQKQE